MTGQAELWWANGVIEMRETVLAPDGLPVERFVTAVHPGLPEKGNTVFRLKFPREAFRLPNPVSPIYEQEAEEWVS